LQYTANTSINIQWGKVYRTKIGNYQNHVHKMVPSLSIIGLSQEFEDMAKKNKTSHSSWKYRRNKFMAWKTCNQAFKELEIEFNNIKMQTMKNDNKIKLFLVMITFSKIIRNRVSSSYWFLLFTYWWALYTI
jgi:hypothetical protein